MQIRQTHGPEQGRRTASAPKRRNTLINRNNIIGESDSVDNHTEYANKAYISNSYADTVSVVDTTTDKVMATMPVAKAPVNSTFTPDGKQVYVACSQAGVLSIIDNASNSVVGIIATGAGPNGMAISHDFKRIFLTSHYENMLQVVILETGEVSSVLPIEKPGFISVTRDGKKAYIVHPYGNTMSVIDTSTFELLDTITLEKGPTVVTIYNPGKFGI